MKKKYQYALLILLWIMFCSTPLSAKDIYVTGVTNITMRTGPGVDHKIVVMLKSGTKLQILEYQKDWTQIRASNGKTGWVLSRFLTEQIPAALVVDKLKEQNSDLISKLNSIKEDNKKLVNENAVLTLMQEKYNKLEQESAGFLKLDAEYKKQSELFEIQKNQIAQLEESLDNEEKLWFLSGGGVLIVGLFFGLSMRKKRKNSLL